QHVARARAERDRDVVARARVERVDRHDDPAVRLPVGVARRDEHELAAREPGRLPRGPHVADDRPADHAPPPGARSAPLRMRGGGRLMPGPTPARDDAAASISTRSTTPRIAASTGKSSSVAGALAGDVDLRAAARRAGRPSATITSSPTPAWTSSTATRCP